jgi:flavin-dependent thymidylate synthase
MVKIILAGYNLDSDVINALKRSETVTDPTPETLSAAYARISRDPKEIPELRANARADVEKARKTNQRIVFDYGHASVAEHVCLNFDIMDISRLAIEAVEHHRLASYTEKSQRYVKISNGYRLLSEIENSNLSNETNKNINSDFDEYSSLLNELLKIGREEKLAGEDARYVLPLATTGQLGMTVNARTLEFMIKHFASHPLEEVRQIGAKLHLVSNELIPSLLKYMVPSEYDKRMSSYCIKDSNELQKIESDELDFRLVDHTEEPDLKLSAIFIQKEIGCSYSGAMLQAKKEGIEDQKFRILKFFENISEHDPAPRELEHIVFTFEGVVSAAAFGQWKRHRMASLTVLPYDPNLGITIPPYISEARAEARLKERADQSAELYLKLKNEHCRELAEYVLLNAHRRRIILTTNARELYVISRLREDEHAQWDIRRDSSNIIEQAREVAPLTMLFACGKDKFKEIYSKILDS